MDTLSPTEIATGYRLQKDTGALACLFCDEGFEAGVIYEQDGRFVDAERAVQKHIDSKHEGAFTALLGMGRKTTGLSEVQETMLRLSYEGLSDKQIASRMGGRSPSTVRNHRFQLRRKYREAKMLIALMDLLETRPTDPEEMLSYHAGLQGQDDRIRITRAQAEQVLNKVFQDPERTRLDRMPKKQKHKLVVLRYLVDLFERKRRYTHQELTDILGAVYVDHAVLRRGLVDYRFMARETDGSEYWRIDD